MAPTVGVVAPWFQAEHLEVMVAVLFLEMGKNFVDDLLVFNTGESLPRERGPAHGASFRCRVS